MGIIWQVSLLQATDATALGAAGGSTSSNLLAPIHVHAFRTAKL